MTPRVVLESSRLSGSRHHDATSAINVPRKIFALTSGLAEQIPRLAALPPRASSRAQGAELGRRAGWNGLKAPLPAPFPELFPHRAPTSSPPNAGTGGGAHGRLQRAAQRCAPPRSRSAAGPPQEAARLLKAHLRQRRPPRLRRAGGGLRRESDRSRRGAAAPSGFVGFHARLRAPRGRGRCQATG